MISVYLQEVRSHGRLPDPKLNHLSHSLICVYCVVLVLHLEIGKILRLEQVYAYTPSSNGCYD